MKGTSAIAESLRHAADYFYTVPGYPVTALAAEVGANSVINEKVALEYALGDSLSGQRAAVIVKNVGLNACADPLINATTQGIRSGVVVVAGDDVNVVGSQNAQDSRYYGELAQVPVIEPDSETGCAAVEEAFRASERFSRVALLRLTPHLLDADIPCVLQDRTGRTGSLAGMSLTMSGRVTEANRRWREMFEWSLNSPLNRFNGEPVGVGAAPGASHVVTVYPPAGSPHLLAHAREYGRPFVQEHRVLNAPDPSGPAEEFGTRGFYRTFCPGCPFKAVMRVLVENRQKVICDMGCSLFAMNPPYQVGVASYGLGSSIAVAARSTGIALSGDYAMLHSGINALIDIREKGYPLLCIVLKNRRMAMVGGEACYPVEGYLGWADPFMCRASDEKSQKELFSVPKGLSVVIVEGTCPKGERHETVEC